MPDPCVADYPHDHLRAALHHTDLLSPSDIPAQPPSDGDIARMTLLYLAERDASCRTAIEHLVIYQTPLQVAVRPVGRKEALASGQIARCL